MKHLRYSGLAAALVALAALVASPVQAQEPDPAPDQERLTVLARVHMAINDARDEFHGEIARVHDAEGRLRAREKVDARIAEVLAEHEVTRQDYDDFILLISIDGELRASFEEIVASLQQNPSER